MPSGENWSELNQFIRCILRIISIEQKDGLIWSRARKVLECIHLIVVRLEDDGRGFDLQEALARDGDQKGLGLAAMHERARMLEGSLTIMSQKGAGTRVNLTIPIDKGRTRL